MNLILRRDLIIKAVRNGDCARIDQLIELCKDAERAKDILRTKGYGESCMSISKTAALVPDAKG